MPTYVCTITEDRLSPDQKSRIAGEITRIHCEVTGAPTSYTAASEPAAASRTS